MVKFRPGIARCRRLPGRVSSLAVGIGLLVAACGPAQTTATGAATPHGTAEPSSSASPPPRSTADCASVATCYTPQQLEVAYGVQPLLQRGIDGSGETVVLPELAETQLNPPMVTDLRQDFAAYDGLFRLPAPRLKVVSTFPGPAHPWLGFVNPAIYQIARSSQYHQAFHDVTAGNSNTAEFPPTTITGYRAGPGWDPVTGWGSPDAQILIPLLARYAAP